MRPGRRRKRQMKTAVPRLSPPVPFLGSSAGCLPMPQLPFPTRCTVPMGQTASAAEGSGFISSCGTPQGKNGRGHCWGSGRSKRWGEGGGGGLNRMPAGDEPDPFAFLSERLAGEPPTGARAGCAPPLCHLAPGSLFPSCRSLGTSPALWTLRSSVPRRILWVLTGLPGSNLAVAVTRLLLQMCWFWGLRGGGGRIVDLLSASMPPTDSGWLFQRSRACLWAGTGASRRPSSETPWASSSSLT